MGTGQDDVPLLPHYVEPDTPMIGSTGRHPRTRPGAGMGSAGAGAGAGGGGGGGRLVAFWRQRPRLVGSLLFAVLVVLIVLPDDNRSKAHSALTKAGVPLPDELPERLQGFIDYLNFDDGSNDLKYVPPPPLLETEDFGLPDTGIDTPHKFDPNGQLLVEPLSSFPEPPAPHPILTLIKRAEIEWNKKVQRQSKTLKDAVHEYRRRYKRNPPRGFEQWWAYAKANRVILVDEYDQIHRDLQPFWALEPGDLAHRVRVMQERAETFTIKVTDGKTTEEGEQAFLRRAKDLSDLISRFSAHVPDVNLTFTRHDQPACQLDVFHKERMLELAALGEYWGPSDYLENSDVRLSNWAIGCPPDSPLRIVEQAILDEMEENGEDSPPTEELVARYKKAYGETQQKPSTSPARSYIYDHSSAMDICQHPESMNLHGFTSVAGTDPGPLVPLFTFAKTNVHSDILVTPLEQYSDTYIGYEPDWDKKTKNMLMWRGSTTGIDFYVQNDWKNSQRARLHFLANDKEGTKSVLWAEGDGPIREKTYNVNGLNRAYMDVAFAGGPVQCDPETCTLMNKLIDFRDTMGLNEAYQYKYVMDVDGNGWSGRFHRLMSMKACVFKSTLFPEWYADRIQPWLHYVPVKVDYSDLYDIMTFFHGTPEGHGSHDELANKIGLAGKHWARDHWRKQDMAAYMFRLILEWARLLHRNDEDSHSLDFDFDL
ncbi:glycosyltransferase family 90 protein [Rhodotorula toruloides]|uniref:Glycosyltransferase family 90 protein n=1 Tax=Rhodotorula toruloides TaxID=5286 RepID=A0A511K9S3_RHOTO|nr:glycosyltransferase family 90 protein [Rhodotorula toruloides]